jgi:hypothetical protein
MLAIQTVHTIGVNWGSILAIGAEVIIIVSAVGALVVKLVNRGVKDQTEEVVKKVIREDVTPRFLQIDTSITELQTSSSAHDRAIAKLQGIQEGKRLQLDELAQSGKT